MSQQRRAALVAALFAAFVFWASALMFSAELMVGRILLPLFGSSASVWTTCLMAWQALLLVGYAAGRRWVPLLAAGGWVWPHAALVLGAVGVFPLRFQPGSAEPLIGVLTALLGSIALPFVALSTASMAAQAWFMATDHPDRRDPWFLYGMSNLGALLALVLYPVWIEANVGLTSQLRAWTFGYLGFVLLHLPMYLAARHGSTTPALPPAVEAAQAGSALDTGSPSQTGPVLQWALLSAAGSALLMAISQVVTLDAPMPLVWAIPLAVYLATLVLTFGRRPLPRPWVARLGFVAVAGSVVCLGLMTQEALRQLALVGVGSLILFVGCLLAHQRLVAARPVDARELGGFYLVVAAGGWAGSALMAVLVPLLFAHTATFAVDCALAGLLLLVAMAWPSLAEWVRRGRSRLRVGLLSVFAILAVAVVGQIPQWVSPSVACARTFYGLYRVQDVGGVRTFVHGNTVHGTQRLSPGAKAEPQAYYHRAGPIGRAMERLSRDAADVGVGGMGVGILATFARPGQRWDFYELDPMVETLARRHFTFLADAEAPPRVVIGDVRLRLAEEPPGRYDVLIMDTFSSDAVPFHLLTREALALYHSRLKPSGVLILHVTNRIFDLTPVVEALARDSGASLSVGDGLQLSEEARAAGGMASVWLGLTWSAEADDILTREVGWVRAAPGGLRPWTDDRLNVWDAWPGLGEQE